MYDRIKVTVTQGAGPELVRLFAESAQRLKDDKTFVQPHVRSE